MTGTIKDKFKNCHLADSIDVLFPIGVAYGISPNFPEVFDFKIEAVDLKNIFRATMGLYMGMIILWIIGLAKRKYWFVATITNLMFFASLGIGRLVSISLDGLPSTNFLFGMILEFLLALWGLFNLRRYGYLETKV